MFRFYQCRHIENQLKVFLLFSKSGIFIFSSEIHKFISIWVVKMKKKKRLMITFFHFCSKIPFQYNCCISLALHDRFQAVTLLTSAYFVCIVGSGYSHLPLYTTSWIFYGAQATMTQSLGTVSCSFIAVWQDCVT